MHWNSIFQVSAKSRFYADFFLFFHLEPTDSRHRALSASKKRETQPGVQQYNACGIQRGFRDLTRRPYFLQKKNAPIRDVL